LPYRSLSEYLHSGHELVLTVGVLPDNAFTVIIEGVRRTLAGTGFSVAVTLEEASTE
jgi:hypothetical protein